MDKLRGSTIIEVLVAMVIILACSTIATVIYLNILQSQNSAQKLKAFQLLKRLEKESEIKANYLNEETESDVFSIKKECKPYISGSSLIQVTYSIRSTDGKELIHQSKIVEN